MILLFCPLFSFSPLVPNRELSPDQLHKIEELVADYRLKTWQDSSPYYFEYSQKDIDTFAEVFNATQSHINLKIVLGDHLFFNTATYKMELLGIPFYVNIKGQGRFSIHYGKIHLTPGALHIGYLKIPPFLHRSILNIFADYHVELGFPLPFLKEIETLQLKNKRIFIKLRQALSAKDFLLFAPPEKIRLQPEEKRFIQQVVFQVILILKDESSSSTLFDQLVRLTFQKTNQLGHDQYDPVTLNKLSLLSLGMFYRIPIISENIGLEEELEKLFESANIQLYRYKIFKRKDWAKHFVYSAVLTALLGEEITERIGAVKEIRDFKFSGFSFSDLLADQAGAIFAKQLLSTPKNGKLLQKRIIAQFQIQDFFPNKKDLPDNMKRKEFEKMFEFPESRKYRKMMKEIRSQVYQSAAYQSLSEPN